MLEEVSMLDWKNAKESKPKQGKRVLLKIEHEENAVVGYWGAGGWDAYCEGNFESSEVTHYAEYGELPE